MMEELQSNVILGNLWCSEQAALAMLILKPDFKWFAIRDVTAHTFFEVKTGERWTILDPIFDNRIRNKNNQIVSFNDIEKWLKGDKAILKLPKRISERTIKYLDLFRKSTYKPVRMAFGQPIVFRPENLNLFVGMSSQEVVAILSKYGLNIFKKPVYFYLAYIRNNIIRILKNTPYKLRKKVIYKIQDFLFTQMDLQNMKGWIPKNVNAIYLARNYQFLNRFKNALEIYKSLTPSKRIYFYESQIYFKEKNKEKFHSLSEILKKNIFYRYMYWLLNKKYLLSSNDSLSFNKFPFKLFDYDKIILKKGKLILP